MLLELRCCNECRPVRQSNNFGNGPHMRPQASFHRRSNTERLMDAGEIVVRVEQRDHGDVIVKLLTEGVRQARKSSHLHSHVKILPLNVAGADVLRLRLADDFAPLGPKTLRGAVALLSLGIVAEYFDQLGVVDLFARCIRDSRQIHLVTVRGQLDSIRKSACNILKEVRRTPRVPPANSPTDNELRLGVNRCEGPNVSRVAYTLPHLRRSVLFLRVAEAPDFIDLNTLRSDVANNAILMLGTRLAHFGQQPQNGALRHVSHARRGTNGAAFDQGRDDRDFLRRAEYVCHKPIVRYRFRISERQSAVSGVFIGLSWP